jgi:hypothetical protein
MVPGTMSSFAVASTVSRSATGSKGLKFVADTAVPPKEHATAATSARIRVVMILLLGHADELTVGPPGRNDAPIGGEQRLEFNRFDIELIATRGNGLLALAVQLIR